MILINTDHSIAVANSIEFNCTRYYFIFTLYDTTVLAPSSSSSFTFHFCPIIDWFEQQKRKKKWKQNDSKALDNERKKNGLMMFHRQWIANDVISFCSFSQNLLKFLSLSASVSYSANLHFIFTVASKSNNRKITEIIMIATYVWRLLCHLAQSQNLKSHTIACNTEIGVQFYLLIKSLEVDIIFFVMWTSVFIQNIL